MSSWQSGQRPITIAILAMGGEGGGVLSDWIVTVGEAAGFHAQSTSVAGVAQRTGATVYYVELFSPEHDLQDGARRDPVLSLFPTPGEVDIVIASELMEAGRAVQRGFCTPDRTTLITSTNRVYAITERIALGDGRADDDQLLQAARVAAKRFISADFMAMAERSRSVISAALFGALAGSAALPFSREQFEDAVRTSGKGVESSLAAFALGFDAARQPEPVAPAPAPDLSSRGPVPVTIGRRPPSDPAAEAEAADQRRHAELAVSDPAALVGPALRERVQRVSRIPAASRSMTVRGVVRTAVYQGPSYTDRYLDRVERMAALDSAPQARLSTETARNLALWMCYQDTIHVALQKIRRRRLEGIRQEARANPGQLLQVREYLHPQIEEITDTLPAGLGRHLASSRVFGRVVAKITRNGMVVNTTSAFGFTSLWITARMRPLRPRSLRFAREQQAIDDWLDRAARTAPVDYELACEIVLCQGVLKGYGQTHAHGSQSFARLMAAADELSGRPGAAAALARLRAAALADEDGSALQAAMAIELSSQPITTS